MRPTFRLFLSRKVKLMISLAALAALPLAALGWSHPVAQAVSAAPKFVQEKDKLATGKTVAQSFATATTAGNLLVAYVIWDNTGSASVTDSRGDTFVSAAPATIFNTKYSAQVFYAKNSVGGADTVTASFATATKSFGILYIHEYSGADKTNPFDGSVAAKGGTAAMSSGNLTTTSANDLLFGAGASVGAVSAAGAGYTARSLFEGNLTEDKSAAAAGSYSATATQSGSWAMQLVAFKPAAAPADTTPPSVPTGVTATAVSASQINLSWTPSTDDTGVTGYTVYRNGVQIAGVTGTSYQDTGLAGAATYNYTVSAIDAAGNASAQSVVASATTATPDTTPPTVPTGLTATPVSLSQINLSWAATTDDVGVAGYAVYRDGSQVAKIPGTSYQDAGLVAGTTYTYTVTAFDAAGNESAPAAAVTANTFTPLPDTTPPSAPANLTATAPSATQVTLNWTAATDDTGVTAYQVSRDGTVIATTTSTTYSDTTVAASTGYTYTVTASDAAGNVSAASNAAAVTTPAAPVQGSCALPAYPTAACAGRPAALGATFTSSYNGDYVASTPGEVIDNWHITGDLVINATGVTITNSQIDGHIDNDTLDHGVVTSFSVSDSTIGPASCSTEGWPSLNAHDFKATRVFLRGHQDGLDVVTGGNASMSDSFIQPCFQPASVVGSDGFHSDGVQDQCGATCTNIVMTHNTFDSRAFGPDGSMNGNSAIYLGSPYNGSKPGMHAGDVVLRNNMFLGGSYTTSLWWDPVGDQANWIIDSNVWVNGTWETNAGPTDSINTCGHQTWTGNAIVTADANYNVTSTVAPLNCVN